MDTVIGRGWTFPAALTADGAVALTDDDNEIEQALHLILATAPGERPMRPRFGCGVHQLVFEPLNAATAGRLDQEIRTALDRWEPRITVDNIAIATDDTHPGLLYVDLAYRIRATNSPRNLVFPFYTIPPEAPSTPGPSGTAGSFVSF
ncbi:hypothetical protein SAMN05216268_1427 [Streptomyces yunnanensis]|uniref:IraD/Gp25-like domain-containing protein n=1 Tax=Streptomyces yunnanensis TaxID=156453 RepID=A0A9X8N9K9_9ACTN|nr:hypothetical protein SAMN05216268_1427 [Streptomyces yunnanensis]